MASDNGQEIRAIAELAADVKYMRKEIDAVTKRLEDVATQDDISQLRKEIEANSPSALFSQITKVAVGLVSIAAAVGVIIAILKAFKAI
jgi:hypothetical protein